MLPVVDTAVADDVDGEHAVFEFRDDFFNDQGLVDNGAHRDRVVAGTEDKIVKQRSADEVALDIVVKRDIALRDIRIRPGEGDARAEEEYIQTRES